tara:strand:+ start:460 stop:1155 length:696 start_codon:yes stop_codon:yes gene_type:complete
VRIFIGTKENNKELESSLKFQENLIHYIKWPSERKNKLDQNKIFPLDFGAEDDFYIHFSGYQKISEEIINKMPEKMINIHPAPPWYRGSGGINLAIYNRERDFGITVHKITKEYDDGEILGFFPIELETEASINDSLILINNKRIEIIKDIISKICKAESYRNIFSSKNNLPSWSGPIRKINEIDELSILKYENSSQFNNELLIKLRAFSTKHNPITIELDGKKYNVFSKD